VQEYRVIIPRIAMPLPRNMAKNWSTVKPWKTHSCILQYNVYSGNVGMQIHNDVVERSCRRSALEH